MAYTNVPEVMVAGVADVSDIWSFNFLIDDKHQGFLTQALAARSIIVPLLRESNNTFSCCRNVPLIRNLEERIGGGLLSAV